MDWNSNFCYNPPVMEAKVERLPKSVTKLTITVPAPRVDEAFGKVLDKLSKEIKIDGFRPGKAPKESAKEKIDPGKLHGEALNQILSETIGAAISQHHLRPIINPRVEIKNFGEGKEAVFEAMIVEKPEISVGDYKKAIAEIRNQKLEMGKSKIETATTLAGAEEKAKQKDQEIKLSAEEVLEAVMKVCEVEVADLLIEEEVNRMLSRLIDQTARLGMTVEQYLASQNRTVEQLKGEYKKAAGVILKQEFVLVELAEKENVAVSESEIETAIKAAPDEKSRQELAKPENKLYIGSVLLKSKTIQRLASL